MKLYVASSNKLEYKFTNDFLLALQNLNIDIFFPESIGIWAKSLDEMDTVDAICCKEIRDSDILIAIYPFGYSVSVEIGRFLAYKDMQEERKKCFIILDVSEKNSELFNKLRSEAMIIPHVNTIVTSTDELVSAIKKHIEQSNY